MNFEESVRLMKLGKKVRRPHWKKGIFTFIKEKTFPGICTSYDNKEIKEILHEIRRNTSSYT